MKIFVTGGTGFVGSRLVPYLLECGHELCLLTRPGERLPPPADRLETVEGDPLRPGPWWNAVAGCTAAVNLAGESILGRWNDTKKRLIRDSRVLTTRHLVDAIPTGGKFALLSTSAVGVYGDAGERELDEGAPLGSDFLAQVAQDWEAEARRAEVKGVRTVIARFAVVLGPNGGALEQMRKAADRFAGGPIGTGRQWFSWIHREDLGRAIRFLLESEQASGVYNLGSPQPCRQVEVAHTLGRLLHRPAFLPAPGFALRLLLGEFSDTILFSQKMIPRRLLDAGFTYAMPDLEPTLRDILGDQTA